MTQAQDKSSEKLHGSKRVRLGYVSVLTVMWLAVVMLRGGVTVSPVSLLVVVALTGAWLAATGSRAGYLAFSISSVVMILFMVVTAVFMLAPAMMLFMGGKSSDMLSVLGAAAALLALAGFHAAGIAVLRGVVKPAGANEAGQVETPV